MHRTSGRAGAAETVNRRAWKKAVARRDLLLAARSLLGDRGLYAFRMEDVAGRAGIAKGSLYLHFRSKEDLVLAVTESAFEELGRLVDSSADGAGSLHELLSRIVDAHLRFFAENRDLMRILHQVRGMLKFNRREWRPLRAALVGHLNRLARRLGSAAAPPRLSPARRRLIATMIFGGVSGAASVLVAAAPRKRSRRIPRVLTGAFVAMALACAAEGPDRRVITEAGGAAAAGQRRRRARSA